MPLIIKLCLLLFISLSIYLIYMIILLIKIKDLLL